MHYLYLILNRSLLISILFFSTFNSFAQDIISLGTESNIFIIRHAEKLSGADPLLTVEGNIRAGDLMRILQTQQIKRIYVTEFKRTQNTADSLRILLGIDTVQIIADTSCASLFTAISNHQDWNKPILIISHSNIIQKIIYKLGITDFPQEYIPANEFDNLYHINFTKNEAMISHQKYGRPSANAVEMKH